MSRLLIDISFSGVAPSDTDLDEVREAIAEAMKIQSVSVATTRIQIKAELTNQ